jgi:hypothetical protein
MQIHLHEEKILQIHNTRPEIDLASVLNNIRCNQADISCLGGVFAKNTSLETKFRSTFGLGNFSSLD